MSSMFIKRPNVNKTGKEVRELKEELQKKGDELLAMQEMVAALYEGGVS